MSDPPVKRRSIADFFQPKARERLNFANSTTQVIPQKRASPAPDVDKRSLARSTDGTVEYTPQKHRVIKDARSPKSQTASPLPLPRSGSLPIRSPLPKSASKPANVYKSGRLFDVTSNSPTPSPPARRPSSPKKTPATVTFADTSSLLTSTQAVVKQGKVVAVRDSDDDDSDSIVSLEELFGTKKPQKVTSNSSPDDGESLEKERRRMLSAFTHGRSEPLIGKDKLRELEAKRRKNTFDISKLIADHQLEQEQEDRIQKSRQQYEKSMKVIESNSRQEINVDLLTSMVQGAGGDEDDVARLLNAVSRTEALSAEKSFAFFGSHGPRDLDEKPAPIDDFPDEPSLRPLFKSYDRAARSRTYLSGYMAELASVGMLSDAIFKWTFDSVLGESDDFLRQFYVTCLKYGSAHHARTSISAQDVRKSFALLGAEPSALQDSIEPRNQAIHQTTKPSFKYLLDLLDLFESMCQHMDFIALSTLVSIVSRLAIDEELMSQGRVAYSVDSLLQALVNMTSKDMRDHVADSLVKDMAQHLRAPKLQSILLTHILPLTPASRTLRHRLALTFLLGPKTSSTLNAADAATILPALTTHIQKSPNFDTSLRNARKLNYSDLYFRTALLDTAISNGHRPPSFPTKQDELTFNNTVDDLTDAIKACSTAISDSGASHMTRTEAKDALSTLSMRVTATVRTKPQRKRHVFDAKGALRNADVVRAEEAPTRDIRAMMADRKAAAAVKLEARANQDRSGSEPLSSSYYTAREEIEPVVG
jgi:hypothetical protein